MFILLKHRKIVLFITLINIIIDNYNALMGLG